MIRHTPGPWKVQLNHNKEGMMPTIHSIKGIIAGLNAYGPINEADAHLIAASPRMLEALEYTLMYWFNGPPALLEEIRKIIRSTEDWEVGE